MKSSHILISFTISVFLSFSQYLLSSRQNQAQAQTARPYAVFVNGWRNCCAWKMTSLQEKLDQMNVEKRFVPYSNFTEYGKSELTSRDTNFIKEGAEFINNKLDRDRPLILIGHSFGGDSILKLIPLVDRRIQFVAVIDPVGFGGVRSSLKDFTITSNVDYFFNRWQTLAPFPLDFSANGFIACNARIKCDQESYNIQRLEDSSLEIRSCTADEEKNLTCPKTGIMPKEITHSKLPTDAYIQRQIGDRIQESFADTKPSLISPNKDILDDILKRFKIPVENLKDIPF